MAKPGETREPWMGDQAAGLRRLFGGRSPQVVAFAAGRESSGRTTLLVQTAAALAACGQRVLIIDENLSENNALACFGLKGRHDLFQVLRGERTLSQTMLDVAPALRILPAGHAARELEHADRAAALARNNLDACLREMQREVDFILIDAAVRPGGHLSPLALAARHMAVIVAAQGNAITQAYALIKRIVQERGRDGFQVAVTRARNQEDASAIFDNMNRVAREHLAVRLDFLAATTATAQENLAHALMQQLPPAIDESGFGWPPVWQGRLEGLRASPDTPASNARAGGMHGKAERRETMV